MSRSDPIVLVESSLNIKLVFHYETMVWCTTGLSSKERSQARAVGQSLVGSKDSRSAGSSKW